ncbi:MAG TPA: APC family permease [Solirubrobacteraceae bacterium]|nr:APC family permease [Solirubrobacteraceae bacterium]
MTATSAPVEIVTEAAVEETRKLRRHFGRFDVLFFLVCTIVGLDTIGSVAAQGAEGFTWLIFLAVFFFLPYAMLTSELGTAFPQEGGPYVWTRKAFGRLPAAVNSLLYWVSNPIWLGGSLTITAITVWTQFFTPLNGAWKWLFALVFIWVAVVSAILSLDKGKWMPTIGGFTRIVLLAVFTISVIAYAFKHGVHGFGIGSFSPTYTVFIAAVPVLIFNYVGFELPSAAGDEMKNPQRDVPFAIARSAVLAVLLYGGPVLAILLVLPTKQVTSLSGFVTAMSTVFTVWGGHFAKDGTPVLTGLGSVLGDIAAIGFILGLLTSGITWIMGADRAQAVACYDGAGPRRLGVISERFGTPVAMNLCTGTVATVLFILATELTSGNAGRYFTAVLGLAISTTTVSYLLIFPALAKLRFSDPDTPRPFRVPGGRLSAIGFSAITTLFAALATAGLLWPGVGTSDPNASLPSTFAGQRLQYEISQFAPLLILIAIGFVFYMLGAPTRKRTIAIRHEVPSMAVEGAASVALG